MNSIKSVETWIDKTFAPDLERNVWGLEGISGFCFYVKDLEGVLVTGNYRPIGRDWLWTVKVSINTTPRPQEYSGEHYYEKIGSADCEELEVAFRNAYDAAMSLMQKRQTRLIRAMSDDVPNVLETLKW